MRAACHFAMLSVRVLTVLAVCLGVVYAQCDPERTNALASCVQSQCPSQTSNLITEIETSGAVSSGTQNTLFLCALVNCPSESAYYNEAPPECIACINDNFAIYASSTVDVCTSEREDEYQGFYQGK